MDAPIRNFINNKDLGDTTKEEFEKIKAAAAGEEGTVTKESAQAYLESQGLSAEVAAQYVDDFVKAFNVSWDEVLDKVDWMPEEASKKLTLGQAQALGNAYEDIGKMDDELGGELQEVTKKIFSKLGDDSGEAIEKLQNVDWSNWDSIEEFKEYLKSLNVDFEDVDIEAYADSLQKVNHAMRDVDLKSISDDWNNFKSNFEGMKIGDTIDAEEFNKLGDNAQEYFTRMADGTYQLTKDARAF